MAIPCGVFRERPAPGNLVRCEKGLSLDLDEAWSNARKRDIGIEHER
ncbi:MAG TPA: hypothetical protein VKP69_05110 [Isosphaeraceae bacterium]|nr:hypothetical protein [Isosphaeraceae bacterium]